jgi:DNA-binding transcriptional LysR family regulator
MLINHELLRTFLAAARTRTFGEAAAQRRVTKSAISQQVKALEAQLGVPLFERVGRAARPTPAGARLADVLERELAAIDDALVALTAEHAEIAGELRLGAPRPFARAWLPPRLAPLLRAHPALRVRIVFGVPSELERALVQGQLDLAILSRAPESPLVAHRAIATETFHAYAAPAYLAAHGTPQTLADIRAARFIDFDDDLPMHAPFWRAAFGARTPVGGEIVCRVASLDEMLALAEQGLGVVVLPDYFARGSKILKELEISREPAKNALTLAWRKGAVESARLLAARDALSS